MFIGLYLCLSAILAVAGLLLISGPPRRRAAYLLASMVVACGFLALFVAASLLVDLLRFGVATSYSYPQDYLQAGPLGWVIMLLLPLGVISPFLIALRWQRRQVGP